ncbi:MAG: Trk system potassium transporter TrkA [Marinilabiliales bacterium]|nr:MAG: Trk system potassium transporter TrkA [Marinilabiliales bacterium]
MKIIVAGAGQVGTYLAKMLSNERHDLIVIDVDGDNLRDADSHLDVLTVFGSATSFETLRSADIQNADIFLAVTHSEDINITSSIFAKKLGAKKTIARVNNGEYLSLDSKRLFNSLGVDFLICPEKLAAKEIVSLLQQTGTTEVFEFSGGLLSLFVLKLEENAPIINKTLIEAAKINKNLDYRAVAIYRDSKTIIPRGDDVFKVGDLVYVITNQTGIVNLLNYAGKRPFAISNVMILGGSRVGRKTATDLEKHLKVKIIEKDKNRCNELAEMLDRTLVINGDGSDIELLMEEGVNKMDAFIAVTGNSETNILSCLLAKKMGVKKTIAEIENIDYIDLADNIGIDTIINKKLISASHIHGHTMSAEVACLKCLIGVDAEVFEFIVKPGAKITQGSLKELDIPEDAIIGGVIRGAKSLIAKGDVIIQENDKVVVFSMPSAIQKVQKFFK